MRSRGKRRASGEKAIAGGQEKEGRAKWKEWRGKGAKGHTTNGLQGSHGVWQQRGCNLNSQKILGWEEKCANEHRGRVEPGEKEKKKLEKKQQWKFLSLHSPRKTRGVVQGRKKTIEPRAGSRNKPARFGTPGARITR